jgi:hypothetical protein
MFLDDEGWKANTPDEILEGQALYPGVMCIWDSFVMLGEGRDFTQMGTPLPIKYRDIRDEAERCDWPFKPEAERLIRMLDREYLMAAAERQKQE